MVSPPGLHTGRIDVHSHLIPGVDDGCRGLGETLRCVERLIAAGYVGSLCTPHIWPLSFPDNSPGRVRELTAALQDDLTKHGLDFQLWPGGELRLWPDVIPYLEDFGVPTLADSRHVLMDFWEGHWAPYVDDAFEWFLERDYIPVLAHPERIGIADIEELADRLDRAAERGVLLQGNAAPITGHDGPHAQGRIRRFFGEGRYSLIGLDLHRPDTLEPRLRGLGVLGDLFTREAIDALTVDAPRHLLGV